MSDPSMSESHEGGTPRTDSLQANGHHAGYVGWHSPPYVEMTKHARQLERELAEAKSVIAADNITLANLLASIAALESALREVRGLIDGWAQGSKCASAVAIIDKVAPK